MNSLSKIVSVLALVALLLGFAQCSKIEVEQPAPTDTAAIVAPVFRLAIDSTGKAILSLDSLMKKYPDFSILFEPISNGQFLVDLVKKEVRFEKNNNNWTIDSTNYELCLGKNCDFGKIIVRNFAPSVESECDSLAPIGPITVGSLSQTIVTLSPRKSWRKVTEIRPGLYNASIATDSTKIQFRAVDNPIFFGYDEVGYTLVDSLGKCHRGIVRLKIGDECSVEAADDVLSINGLSGQWNVSQLLDNEVSPCSIPLDGFQFRLATNQLSYVNTSIATPNGVASDTMINGIQTFFYRKRNLMATKDSLYYYLYDRDNSLRISRAKIRITFQ